MKISTNYYCYEKSKNDKLMEVIDFELIGFVDDNSMFSKFRGILQPVYLINGKSYVGELLKYPLEDIVKEIEDAYQAWGENLDYIKKFINNLSVLITRDDFFIKEYALKFNYLDLTLKMADLPKDKIIKEEPLSLSEEEYIGAIKLPDGYIVVGSEEFIEKIILERVDDVKTRFSLLDTLYVNYKDYHRKDELLIDIMNNHFDEFDQSDKRKIQDMKDAHDFLMQGITIAEDISDSYKGVKIRRI